jgi:uncharacterized cupin superfamily protein
MKPLINLENITEFEENEHDSFKGKYSDIGRKIGANQLGYNLTIVPPGKKFCPFHNHHVNEEMFLILEGTGLLRFGKEEYKLMKNDIIACPNGDRTVAHQIINNSNTDLKYLALSIKINYEICEYPDSDKIFTMVGPYENSKLRHISKASESYNYYDDEE